jgi:anti-anti-sigma regulatory factor
MEFKIDTRDNYVLIETLGDHLSVNMAAMLEERASKLADTGSQNFLIDLESCQTADGAAFEALAVWHENCYSEGRSLVFTGMQRPVLAAVKEAQMDGAINIAPTEQEAIDIINMEILERDLFNEEG